VSADHLHKTLLGLHQILMHFNVKQRICEKGQATHVCTVAWIASLDLMTYAWY
jgi:hypothetical protein